VGVLRVYTADHRDFSTADVRFLTAAASLGAIAFRNANMYDLLKKDYQELRDFGVVL